MDSRDRARPLPPRMLAAALNDLQSRGCLPRGPTGRQKAAVIGAIIVLVVYHTVTGRRSA